MIYKLIDSQATCSTKLFSSRDAIQDHLVSFHSIDWLDNHDSQDGEAFPRIEDVSLQYLLDYGTWEVEEIEEGISLSNVMTDMRIRDL